jgi:microcystin-dependent protein
MTLARLLSLEAGTVVDGAIDGSGHLILTTHDGTEIDAGYALVAVPEASTTVQGVVELATDAETLARTDTFRAVTPVSLVSTIAAVTAGNVHLITAPAENADYTAYPTGVSLTTVGTGSGWSLNGGFGNITTAVQNNNRVYQMFTTTAGGSSGVVSVWSRTYHTPEGWTPWFQLSTPQDPSTMGLTGEMKMWPAANAPSGWMLCEGGAISRTTFAALFALIGTTYGVGDGTTTFNVPDMRGRVPTGFDSTQTEFNARGKTGGEKTHLLTTAEIPSHNHLQTSHSHNFANGGNGALTDGGGSVNYGVQNGTFFGFKAAQPGATTAVNQVAGGGGAHNVLQPYLTIKYIIKT